MRTSTTWWWGLSSELATLQRPPSGIWWTSIQFIPTNESTDTGSAIHEIYQQFAQSSHLDFQPQENQMAIGLVEKGMGITVLPGLALLDLIPNRAVKVIPLKEKLARTVSLLCPREAERSQLTNVVPPPDPPTGGAVETGTENQAALAPVTAGGKAILPCRPRRRNRPSGSLAERRMHAAAPRWGAALCFSVVCDRIAVESKQQGGSTMAEETIQRVLKQYYGHTAFRPGQEELIPASWPAGCPGG